MTPTPSLPSEIWIIIFRLATRHHYDFFDRATIYKAIALKLRISLVSKSWNDLGLPLLYEHLYFRCECRVNAWHIAVQTLERDYEYTLRRVQGSSNAPQHLGLYAKRLDFYIMRNTNVPRCWTPSDVNKLLSLLRLCPNLQTVVYHDPIGGRKTSALFPSLIMKGIAKNCSSLGVFHWASESHTSLLKDIERFSLVEDLHLDLNFIKKTHMRVDVHLPRLQTLRLTDEKIDGVEFLNSFIAQWDLPSLRKLVLDIEFDLSREAPYRFFESLGPSLESLTIQSYSGLDTPSILRCCPTLQEMGVACIDFSGDFLIHPTLSELNFMFQTPKWASRDTHLDSLKSCMDLILEEEETSQLGVIRIVDIKMNEFDDKDDLWGWRAFERMRWETWIDACERKAIRFEDMTGELLKLPRPL
jgi:hypothetical protein